MPDRVAFFLPNLEAGGAERVCVNLANDFVSRGLIVDMTLGRSTGILKKRLAPGIEIVDLNAARTTLAVFPLSRYLRKAKPYALVAPPDHANLVAVWANMLAGSLSRVVATNHSQMSMVIKNTGKLQERMYPHLLRLFERWMYALVSVSTPHAICRLTPNEPPAVLLVSPFLDNLAAVADIMVLLSAGDGAPHVVSLGCYV